jgi:starvation-inducible DNA-binding protein
MKRGMNEMSEGLVGSLGACLSNAVVLSLKAQGHHWNVVGPDFAQFHSFFAEIYTDVYASIDPLAENMRKLGVPAPYRLPEFMAMTVVTDNEVGGSSQAMISDLFVANDATIACLYESFNLASENGQQGIADFLASRIDAHEKWRWQLRSFMAPEIPARSMPGKSEAAPFLEARVTTPVMVQPDDDDDDFEIVSMPSSWCPMCADGECECNGVCECDDSCECGCRYNKNADMLLIAAASRRAPKKDRIYGSKRNPKGSASGGKKITFSAKTETALRNKVTEHNKNAKEGRKATMGQLKAVYRRGAGAFSSSHRPGKTRDQWAMARVNAYLKLLRSGSPSNPKYVQDNDLLPKGHPKSLASDAVIAAAYIQENLTVILKEEKEYNSSEDAIVALAEYSDLSYDVIPALRAAWRRADAANENPFERAKELAINLYSSRDRDLLPHENKVD